MESDPYLHSSFTLLSNFLLFIVWNDFYYLLTLVLLLLCSGLFSGSEIAMFSLSHDDLEEIQEHDTPQISALTYLKSHTKRLLALILICNTFVNIGIALVVEQILEHWLPVEKSLAWSDQIISWFSIFSFSREQLASFLYFLIAVVGATTLILFFGEVMPKIYGRLNTRKLALAMAIPLRLLDFVFSPLTSVMVGMTNRFEKRLLERKVGLQSTSKEDLDTAIDLAVSDDAESGKQVDILKGIIKFNDVSTKQVMTPRTQVYGLDFNSSFSQIITVVQENGFSRLPVYNGDFDQITGILYAKDLIGHLDEAEDFEWQTLIRTNLLYVPESRKINEILNDFREQHVHMAFVVDEYGGTNGIVTLEDIMEEIVGEIKDEFDEQHELNYSKIDSHNYIFDGKTLINDMCRVLGIDIFRFDDARGNADSIAGLLLEHSGEMPRKDQEMTIEDLKFKVISVNKRRIEQIKITI
ncbi:MAG: gliding motility-associated protein GldE [Saprospiraceae bacterium]|nr:gliding motility-associated protein GldE [Saprospiraceae bacterium]MBK8485732.1 gliding motility-associated protein GldE [Saprospiraceae bacterium]MBK9222958.1 gliding motility-associated protein GldE [Saprospiraceae bacterium]MBK9726981.1 gliding motility-associated protein GldE [Saprospiraceae bacterium]